MQLLARDRRKSVALVGALVLVGLMFLVIASIRTSSARFVDTTASEANLFEAGTVDVVTEHPSELVFRANNVYPGLVLENCVVVVYRGSLAPAEIRLHASIDGGTGLERFLLFEVTAAPDCEGSGPARTVYDGTLDRFVGSHRDFASGLDSWTADDAGDTRAVRFSAEVVDDNGAQGLNTVFTFRWEARLIEDPG